MPVAIAGFVGGLGLFAGAAVGVSLGWGAALAVGSIIIAGTIVGVKRATELKDPGQLAVASGREVMVRSTEVPRIIVYGQAAVGGLITHQNTFGAENRSMTIEVIHTGHEIEEFVSWLFDDKEIPIADVDDINAAGDGSVDADTNSHGFGPVGSTPTVYLRGHLGASAQAVDSALDSAYSEIGSNHRHRGCARSNIRLDLLVGSENIWDGGPPRNIRAVVKGKKVYDPRLDSTFTGSWGTGSGAHRVATPATWEWSENPALCWADYRIDAELGPGWDSGDIDYNSVAIAADACEVAAGIPTSATEDRFTCNGVFDTSESPNAIIGQILAAMSGSERRFKGKWHVYAGIWEAPSFTLDEDDFIGTVEYRKQPETQSGDRYNLVRGSYVDPLRYYQSSEFLEVSDATLQSDRDAGRELPKELDLRAVNGEYQAQRLAYRLLAQAADSGIFVCQVGYSAANMRVGVRVEVTLDELGFDSKIFRLVNMRHVPFAGFELTLKEDSEAAWDDPEEGDYGTRTAAGVITFPAARRSALAIGFSTDADGKPAGWRGTDGITDRSQISFNNGRLQIASSPDTTVGYGLPAIPINDAKVYQLKIRHLSSASSSDGLYIRMSELNTTLSSGKTHIGAASGAEAMVQGQTSNQDMVSNGAMPGTTAVTETFTYTPTSGARFASLTLYNTDPATAGVNYLVEWIALTERGSYIDLLPGVRPPGTTQDLIPESVDEVLQVESVGASLEVQNDTAEAFAVYATFAIEATTDSVELVASCKVLQTQTGGATRGDVYLVLAYASNTSGPFTEIAEPFVDPDDTSNAAGTAAISGLSAGTYYFGILMHVEETSDTGEWGVLLSPVTLTATLVKR